MAFGLFPSSSWLDASRAALAKSRSDEAVARANAVGAELETTQQQVDRLYMIVEAMWSMMKDRFGVTEEELGRLVESIDLRDGVRDGKTKRNAPPCAKCGRVASIRTGVCLYCGHKNPAPTF